MTYKIGDRMQSTYLPPIIDDYVSREDPVRVYDAFVDTLDLAALGIPVTQGKGGADEYYPREMLKLLIYGYSYGIRSSRKLERACYHNLSFIWLMGDLKPDYRTIARFRKEYQAALSAALKHCVRFCLELDLIAGNTLFIDGSSFRANAGIRQTWTTERCAEHLQKLDEHIDQLLTESEQIDQSEETQESPVKLNQEIKDQEHLRLRVQEIAAKLQNDNLKLHNTTDPECVTIKGRQGTHAGYNAQSVVDEKNGLIVHTEALSHSIDANELSGQVVKAGEVLGCKPEIVSCDCGYYSLDDLAKVDSDITIVIPSIRQAQREKDLHPLKPFGKEQFKYDKDHDRYICPAGKYLEYNGISPTGSKSYYKARQRDCHHCHFYGTCTTAQQGRVIARMREEELQERLKNIYHSPQGQAIYRLRKQKVELTFGHFKRNLLAGHFLLRGRAGATAELSLLATCFNLTRMMTLLGIPNLLAKLTGNQTVLQSA
jgi:transposase